MRRLLSAFVALLALSLTLAGRVGADEPAAAPPAAAETAAGEAKKEPKTVEVERGPFTVTLDLQGAFVPVGAVEVAYRPQVYGGDLEVVEAAEGGMVVKGQTLVRFKSDKLDEQIRSTETDVALARTQLKRQEEEAKRAQEAAEIAMIQAQRAKDQADETLKIFREIGMPMRKGRIELGLQGMEDRLQDAAEELAQLEKMYGADDLTEETEDIVLKRTRRNLERSRRSSAYQKQESALALEIELPREHENLLLAQRRETNAWDKAKATIPLGLEQGRLELEKARANVARQETNLQRLLQDRDALAVTAPVGGIAVPGAFGRGKWSGLEDAARALQPGRKAAANQALFTIFAPGALSVRTTVAEAQVLQVREGLTGSIVPTAAPDLSLPVKVARLARVSSDGQFEMQLDLGKTDERLMPGYGGKVKLELSARSAAITVPEGAVVKDGDATVVHVWADGKATPRTVKTGATSGGRVEVLEGLEAGERVLANPPKAK